MVVLIAEIVMDNKILGRYVSLGIGIFFQSFTGFDFSDNLENAVHLIFMNRSLIVYGLMMRSF